MRLVLAEIALSCTVWTCFGARPAFGQEVAYELIEGSILEALIPCQGGELVSGIDMEGTMTVVFTQAYRSIQAAITRVDVRTTQDLEFEFSGNGEMFIFAAPGSASCLPAAIGADLRLTVNGGEEVPFTTELASTESFPQLVLRFHPLDGDHCLWPILRISPGVEDLARFFRRGDSNSDGDVNISDALHILGFLFLGGTDAPCLDATDVDDSGTVDVSDAIGLLQYLFSAFSPPAVPSCFCGLDAGADALGCSGTPCA